jgi:hypothetical protein
VQPKYTISIQHKCLTRERKKTKKIMKVRKMKAIIGNRPMVKGIEEKGFNSTTTLLQSSKLRSFFLSRLLHYEDY